MRTANIVISCILLAFTGGYAVLIARLPSRDLPNTLGAAFMPWVLAGFLLLLSLLLMIFSLSGKHDGAENTGPVRARDVAGIGGLLLVIALFIILTGYLGFVISSIFFLAALIFISGSRKPLEIILFSVLTTGAVYLLFQKFFTVQLPSGILF